MRLPVRSLDLDGVPAPLDRRQLGVRYTVVDFGGWNGAGLVAFKAVRRVREIALSGRVQVRWLTAREDVAAELFAPRVGLPPMTSTASAIHSRTAGGSRGRRCNPTAKPAADQWECSFYTVGVEVLHPGLRAVVGRAA